MTSDITRAYDSRFLWMRYWFVDNTSQHNNCRCTWYGAELVAHALGLDDDEEMQRAYDAIMRAKATPLKLVRWLT